MKALRNNASWHPKRIARTQPEDRRHTICGFFSMPEKAHGYWPPAHISIVTNISGGMKYSFPYYFPLKSGINTRTAEFAPLLAV